MFVFRGFFVKVLSTFFLIEKKEWFRFTAAALG
jgi:hypothetical protein